MKKLFKNMSMMSQGLRYKLMIAFSLMSIIPLLVCVYLVTIFIFPRLENLTQVSLMVLFSIAIALTGLMLVKRMISPVINMALETKLIASGDFSRTLRVDTEDEIGDLGKSINMMTKRIKDYMEELQSYSLKTRDVNLEIQRKVLALSNLLQIGDMIASSMKLEAILDVIAEKVSIINEGSFTVIFLTKEKPTMVVPVASHNIDEEFFRGISFNLDKDYIGACVKEGNLLKIDSTTKLSPETEGVRETFNVRNCLIIPVVSYRKAIGFILSGNSKDNFRYNEDDIELVNVLSKQLGIAIENDILLKKTKELAIKDDLTGLYNEKYIKERLEEEIKRAVVYQRPCSLLLFNIDNFKQFKDLQGVMVIEDTLRKIATILMESSTEISKAARLGGDEFALVLPEKNKKEAAKLAEEIRRKIEAAKVEKAKGGITSLTISGGVSENPIDGMSANELFAKATKAMIEAKHRGKNRIVA